MNIKKQNNKFETQITAKDWINRLVFIPRLPWTVSINSIKVTKFKIPSLMSNFIVTNVRNEVIDQHHQRTARGGFILKKIIDTRTLKSDRFETTRRKGWNQLVCFRSGCINPINQLSAKPQRKSASECFFFSFFFIPPLINTFQRFVWSSRGRTVIPLSRGISE